MTPDCWIVGNSTSYDIVRDVLLTATTSVANTGAKSACTWVRVDEFVAIFTQLTLCARANFSGNNANRATIRDELPLEAIRVSDKLYNSVEVGRGARNDKMIDEEAQGIVHFASGTCFFLSDVIGGKLTLRYFARRISSFA